MEPTGHYWKAFANWLGKQKEIKVVLVNPYATKQAKELDEFFPEYMEVFKCPLPGKASRHILKTCSFPKSIIEMGEEDVTAEIKKTVGRKKAKQLVETARDSVGVDYGEEAAGLKLRLMLEELELLEKQTEELEGQMKAALQKTDYRNIC